MVPDAAWPGSDQWALSTAPAPGPVGRPGRSGVSNSWGVGSLLSLGRPTCARCPGPLGSCSPVCSRGLVCCDCGVLGHLAPGHRCARSVWYVACAASWAPWPPFTGVPAGCVVLRVRCPGPLGSCSAVCLLGVFLCVRGVLGRWLLFTGVPALAFALFVRCPGPLGSCSPVQLKPVLVNQEQWKRDTTSLWHEDLIVLPSHRIPALLKWTHESSGHVGADGTLKLFKKWFPSTWSDDQLQKALQPIVD